MIEKQEFYHGAALIRLLEDSRCRSVEKYERGYLVNDKTFVFLKYTTKSRTPWRFSFGEAEIRDLEATEKSGALVAVALVCAGDGICALTFAQFQTVLGNDGSWIATRRKFHECYAVSGSAGILKEKIPLSSWPGIVFGE